MAAGTKEYAPSELVTDTQVTYREHDRSSHAKKVIAVSAYPGQDQDNKIRSLKPVSISGSGGFDLDPNSVYRYIADERTHILLATVTGVTPDAVDLCIPGGQQLLVHTGGLWKRLEVFSPMGGTASQVVKVG